MSNKGILYGWHKWCVIVYFFAVIASGYSVWHHYEFKQKGSTQALCNINSKFNCDEVAGSVYSELMGIPLGWWGIAYFLMMSVIVLLVAKGKEKSYWEQQYLFFVSVGVLYSVFLASLSVFVIKVICVLFFS